MSIECVEGHKVCVGYKKCKYYTTCPTPSLKQLIVRGLKEFIIDGKTITLEQNADTSILPEILPKVEELMKALAKSLEVFKKAEEEKQNIRESLLIIVKETGIRKIAENDLTFSATPKQRFKEWTDENAVLEMIPDNYKDVVRTINYKIVNELIKEGKIPKTVLDLVVKSEPIYSLTFSEGAKK